MVLVSSVVIVVKSPSSIQRNKKKVWPETVKAHRTVGYERTRASIANLPGILLNSSLQRFRLLESAWIADSESENAVQMKFNEIYYSLSNFYLNLRPINTSQHISFSIIVDIAFGPFSFGLPQKANIKKLLWKTRLMIPIVVEMR